MIHFLRLFQIHIPEILYTILFVRCEIKRSDIGFSQDIAYRQIETTDFAFSHLASCLRCSELCRETQIEELLER